MKIAVIGAGASGLFAAALLKSKNVDFVLYEREKRAGKKLIATGNGRCNLTNTKIDISRYHGDTNFAEYALGVFDNEKLVEYLEKMGIYCTYERDKVFPLSLQASSVVDMLRLAQGKCEKCECEVTGIKKTGKKFQIETKYGKETYDKVIVCCGGKSYKSLSGGGAYNLLTDLGHTLTPLSPAIVQIKCDGTKALEGIKVNATVNLDKQKEDGEVLFTSYGLSGPPILQLSRDAKGKSIKLDLMPQFDFAQITHMLQKKAKIPYITLDNLFNGILNKKLGSEIIKKCGFSLSMQANELSLQDFKKLVGEVKNMKFHIKDTLGFDNAQVTAGGISCNEFEPTSMESKKIKGLFAAGEMLNIDGDCGGFNLQWAFSSAYVAVMSAIKEN